MAHDLTVGSFFSGIGAFDLGIERAELGRTVYFNQADSAVLNDDDGYADHAVEVLRARWPGAVVDTRSIVDVRLVPGEFDVIAGGFPCQDISAAGKRAGLKGSRSGLWYSMLKRIIEAQPRLVLAENVARLQSDGLEDVAQGLRDAGYTVWATRIEAADLGAPHHRQRLIIVAASHPAGPVTDRLDSSGGLWTLLDRPGVKVARWTAGKSWATFPEVGNAWPTPTKDGRPNTKQGKVRPFLGDAAKLWGTPMVSHGLAGGNTSRGGKASTPTQLPAQVRLWATPLVADGRKGAGMSKVRRESRPPDTLTLQARLWATPIRRDWKSQSTASKPNSRPLSEQVAGPLNPDWVELLMGVPIGWTDPRHEPGDWSGWPAPQGPDQYDFEPARMVPPRSVWRRKQRIMTLGNAVVAHVGTVAGLFAKSLL